MKLKLPRVSKPTLLRVSIFAIGAILVAIFMPRPDKININYEVNRPWSHPQLLAPFDVPIYRDADTKRMQIDSIKENFVPIFMYDNTPIEKIRVAIQSADALAQSDKDLAFREVKRIYDSGVVDQQTAERIANGKISTLKIHDATTNKNVQAKRTYSTRRAYVRLDSIINLKSPTLMASLRELGISNFITPNIIVNSDESEQLLNEMLQPIEAGIGIIQQGERIIDRGDIVTPQLYQILQTYEQELQKRSDHTGAARRNTAIGQILFSFVIMAALYVYLFLYRPKVLQSMRRIICLVSILVVFFIFAVAMHHQFSSGLYIVPFAILPLMVVVFYDTSLALITLLLEILMCAPFAIFPMEFIFIEMMAGMTAIYSTKELSKRSQLIRTSAYVFAAYVVAYCAVELMQVATLNSFSWKLIGYFAVNMVLTSFAYILIFVVEKVFGFISVVTLVELSDINTPVLRELSIECPGTFQHSLAVANIVSSAAHKVNANVQLVRAGALYHDIGKLKNPAFFTENQHGVNPHDALSPLQSAQIIISHIADGLRRAEKEKLPKVIRDMIAQHHGTGTAKYFYTTYCNANPGIAVDPKPFSYPGPNPQTKEASLLMMADAVEAASRSLTDHSEQRISELVDRLIDEQINAGMHKDSPLSFQDITTIKQSFIDSLRTTYHTRIAYPDAKTSPEASAQSIK